MKDNYIIMHFIALTILWKKIGPLACRHFWMRSGCTQCWLTNKWDRGYTPYTCVYTVLRHWIGADLSCKIPSCWYVIPLHFARPEYEISAPLQRNLFWGSTMTMECAVYESAPQGMAVPPTLPAPVTQRGTWKTGSTSSTSSEKWFWSLIHRC